jgi:hypothetical protein
METHFTFPNGVQEAQETQLGPAAIGALSLDEIFAHFSPLKHQVKAGAFLTGKANRGLMNGSI